MAGFDVGDLGKKAKDFLEDEKVQDALRSERAEEVSDRILDGVRDAVDKVTGGKFEKQVDDARDAVDKKIGDE